MPRVSKAQQEAAALTLAETQRRAIVDEFGQLDAELSPIKGKLRRQEELGKLIRSWHSEAEAEATVESVGDKYAVVLSARGMQTSIGDIREVYKALGHDGFLALATVTLKALETAGVDASAVASLTKKERTGHRTLIVRRT
jgi:hypothetical protein